MSALRDTRLLMDIIAAKDAEIARWIDYSAGLEGERSELIAEVAQLQELVREALGRCEGIARAHDLGTPEGARIADGIAALTKSFAPNDATKLARAFNEWTPPAPDITKLPEGGGGGGGYFGPVVITVSAPDPAEAMRADVDEATGCADDQQWARVPVAALRAALKGKGYGK